MLKMRKTCFTNKLDQTICDWDLCGKGIKLPREEADMMNHMNLMDEGLAKYRIAISPLLHRICHSFDFLEQNQVENNPAKDRGLVIINNIYYY